MYPRKVFLRSEKTFAWLYVSLYNNINEKRSIFCRYKDVYDEKGK